MRKLLLGLRILGLTACVYIAGVLTTSTVHAVDFVPFLEQKGIDVQELMHANSVPRNTVAELLNLVDCKDCHRPSQETVATLSESWWDMFRLYPGKNFDDVGYSTSLSVNNNYYCVAYVANQGYMNGYPRSTSPLCSGRFCGERDITNADLMQTVFNITAKTFYAQYNANWQNIKTWLDAQTSTVKNYFSLQDRAVINAAVTTCSAGACALQSVDELQTYAKYCTYEPLECNMKELPFARAGQWPIAEMNILIEQGIFTQSDLQALNVENYTQGAMVVEILGRIKQRMQCVDSDDQDKDGIMDYQDGCYLTPNPSQRDLDRDGIGDVCDDDIDGDTIKNPIGIVDDVGNINIAILGTTKPAQVQSNSMDNCLLIVNTDQRDDDQNMIGNACDIDEKVGIRIAPKQLTNNRFAFVAQYSGTLTNFNWFYGDKKTGSGVTTTHTYDGPGQYVVRVEATTTRGKIVMAYTTVSVGGARANLFPSKLIQQVGEKVLYTIQLQNLTLQEVDYVDIKWGDGRSRQLRGKDIASFVDSYFQQGSYAIYGTVYAVDGRVLPIGSFITVIGGNFCIPLAQTQRKGHCDMDKDGIPDVCDIDIDGDGVPNTLGLILFEKYDCSYDETNTLGGSGGVSHGGTSHGTTGGDGKFGWDNCPFFVNPLQDACDAWDNDNVDTDGDGIYDSDDLCPTIPETFNNTNDTDGCPELEVAFTFPNTALQPGTCLTCPCQYAQNDATLVPGDKVKAVLYDKATNSYVTESDWYSVP